MTVQADFIFVCSPYRAADGTGLEANREYARKLCRIVYELGHIPLAPHLLFTQFLDDSKQTDRTLGIHYGHRLLRVCSELWWATPDQITSGMTSDIEAAKVVHIPIQPFPVYSVQKLAQKPPLGFWK